MLEVSVVIPTYDMAEDLRELLDSILKQTSLPREVIIVDDSENSQVLDLTTLACGEFRKVKVELIYLRNTRGRSLTTARNVGVQYCSRDIVLFLDCDVVLDENYIKEILRVYDENPGVLGVEGYQVNVKISKLANLYNRIFFLRFLEDYGRRLLPSTAATYPFKLKKTIGAEVVSGCNMSFRRGVFNEFTFDEKLRKYAYREDFVFSREISKKCPSSLILTPHAKVVHKRTVGGKPPDEEMIFMNVVYATYLFYRLIPQTLKNKLIFLWSRVGVTIAFLLHAILKECNEGLVNVKWLLSAYVSVLKHLGKIKRGDLGFFGRNSKLVEPIDITL